MSLWRRITGSRFLVVSIVVHLLFALGATAWVVQSITAKRKLTFTSAPPSPRPSQRAMDHQVQMAKKQQTMSAPAMPKRIVSTGFTKVSLPEMPAMPAMNSIAAPSKMAGMGGTGVGLGPAGGVIGSGGGGGGGPVPFFGLRNLTGGSALEGNFYDLKQDRNKKPTGMDRNKYKVVVEDFVKRGWPKNKLNDFYQAPNKLYTTQIFVPRIPADEGPKAFQVEKDVEPKMWVAHYEGAVSPPDSGKYYFVGHADDVLYVRFNGKTVLDACWYNAGNPTLAKAEAKYDMGWSKPDRPFIKGEAIHVEAGRSYPIEILIGEQPGGSADFVLLLEKDGATYQKGKNGAPILPVFRLAESKPPQGDLPPFDPAGPVWKSVGKAGPGSALDVFKKPPSP